MFLFFPYRYNCFFPETILISDFVSFLSNALQLRLCKIISKRNTQKHIKLLFLFPVNQLLIKIRNNRNIRNNIFTLYGYAGLLKHKILRLKEVHISTGKNIYNHISGLKCSYSN